MDSIETEFGVSEAAMDTELVKAIAHAEKLLSAAIDVVAVAEVRLDQTWARNPKVVALAILCRSISNFRASVRLVQQEQVMEARALVRLLYENLLWLAALRERGAFVQDMLEDEAFNRKALAEMTLKLTAKHGADTTNASALKLRGIIKELDRQFPKRQKLQADKTAAVGVVETSYIEYGRLSLEAVHCSITALGRHVSREHTDERIELILSVVPLTLPREALFTVLHGCRALMGAAVAANEIVGFTTATPALAALLTEFEANGWQQGD